ncbi:MAG: hypothetical protein BAA02_02030 [Paenibacillaceae bacterium ZCTH02-B3]|nr:MAG: hypothetical protein BAA02_02030 [Paenibacillaceae bacterium ZCTH02-B3]
MNEQLARLLIESYERVTGRKLLDPEPLPWGREWVIAVTNSGDPIPQEDFPYIVERFYRVERSRSKDTGGT